MVNSQRLHRHSCFDTYRLAVCGNHHVRREAVCQTSDVVQDFLARHIDDTNDGIEDVVDVGDSSIAAEEDLDTCQPVLTMCCLPSLRLLLC